MDDIVYKPPFVASQEIYPILKPKIRWEDLVLLYGKRIVQSGSSPGDNQITTLYTVPEGKIFLLLSASISIANADTSRSSGQFWIRYGGESNGSNRTLMTVNVMPQGQNSNSISPTVPLKVEYGESVAIFNQDANITTLGQVFGYEIGSDLFQTLF